MARHVVVVVVVVVELVVVPVELLSVLPTFENTGEVRNPLPKASEWQRQQPTKRYWGRKLPPW